MLPLSEREGVLAIDDGLGDLCKTLLPIFGDLVPLGDRFGYCAEGEDGVEVVGDLGGTRCLLAEGDIGGVLLSIGDSGRVGLFLICCLGTRVFGPELSLGVGGSPLLHAIEQYMAPRLGKNGLPKSDVWQVWQQKQLSVACQCCPSCDI